MSHRLSKKKFQKDCIKLYNKVMVTKLALQYMEKSRNCRRAGQLLEGAKRHPDDLDDVASCTGCSGPAVVFSQPSTPVTPQTQISTPAITNSDGIQPSWYILCYRNKPTATSTPAFIVPIWNFDDDDNFLKFAKSHYSHLHQQSTYDSKFLEGGRPVYELKEWIRRSHFTAPDCECLTYEEPDFLEFTVQFMNQGLY